jgi:hypothetical protein
MSKAIRKIAECLPKKLPEVGEFEAVLESLQDVDVQEADDAPAQVAAGDDIAPEGLLAYWAQEGGTDISISCQSAIKCALAFKQACGGQAGSLAKNFCPPRPPPPPAASLRPSNTIGTPNPARPRARWMSGSCASPGTPWMGKLCGQPRMRG